MRAEPAETGREQIQTDRHAWREGEGDPDKGEINIGSGDEGYVHRCCEEMQGAEDIKMERGSGDVVKAEGTERYRK